MEVNLVYVKCVKIYELMWMMKIDGLSELMNYDLLACNWLYDNDMVMNNGWVD